MTPQEAIAKARDIERYDVEGNVRSVFTEHARNTHKLLLDIAEAYVSYRYQDTATAAMRRDGSSKILRDKVDAALQAFADHMGKQSCAEK